ncbi:uncharacterized protein M437DRAFT_54913 [Aureobasidium melanogenum CBS 110374]|uniref:Zn(2)-C6 fungal-type domain-containing protein n=1 Tax=Aureobasidium melanogenum (strain CBS 110374) TaxID=1043003 RepID=A0A074WCK8_AURM1|nr:uncharacterized protein M437DRAFT_54913 [Aureobasidium melanogenum CBS 110374]KEQ60236.1 hypothetical protein M437DRAFT_54913 [Aureobasidium melanogenum CBS 110374]
MASGHSPYASPTVVDPSLGPYYSHNGNTHQLGHPEIDDDLALRAELSRSLGLNHSTHESANTSHQHSPQPHDDLQQHHHVQQQQQQQHAQPATLPSQPQHTSPSQHAVNPDLLPEHHASPPPGQHTASDNNRDKRSKVSRACDECRRKKIRCDALNEHETCTNCKRSSSTCAFSRQPLKRGPSKGYIKELAERLNALEGQMQPQQPGHVDQELQSLLAEAAYTDPIVIDPPILAPRPAPAPQHIQPAAQPPSAPASLHTYGNPYSRDSRMSPYPVQQNYRQDIRPTPQSQPINTQPFFKYGADTRRHESVSIPFDTQAGAPILVEWDEEVVDEYYRTIHQTFPLLPHSKHRLRMRLAECPPTLREAFLTVLECTMRTFPSFSSTLRPQQTYAPMMKRAAELLAGYPFENPATHNSGTNLVYLQTLLLMALESDNHGPATVRGQAGPSRAEWLGRAAGVAGQLEINLVRPRERFATEGDPDSEERLSRRVWWVLFILDRWHASSTSDLLKLPENSVVLLPEDQILLGESTYHLARLSFIIGHLAAILTTTKTPETNVMAPSNPASSLLGLTLAGEIDRFRESVESVWGSLNLVHLSYHHCHLLIKRLNPTTEPTELIGHAVKVATVLNMRQTPITPLNHHFAALAAMTLCELVDIEKTRAEAIRGLEHISEALGFGRGLAGHEKSTGWDSAIRDLIVQKRNKLQLILGGIEQLPPGLQHLAHASAENGRPGKFDPTMLTRYGYLTALGQGMFVSK